MKRPLTVRHCEGRTPLKALTLLIVAIWTGCEVPGQVFLTIHLHPIGVVSAADSRRVAQRRLGQGFPKRGFEL